MGRLQNLFQRPDTAVYDALEDTQDEDDHAYHEDANGDAENDDELDEGGPQPSSSPSPEPPFSLIEYSIFVLQGVAMLWAWNMFLSAAPYFSSIFRPQPRLHNLFQAAELSVASVVNVLTMLLLSLPYYQRTANYPRRVVIALVVYTACFTLLAIATFIKTLTGNPGLYFAFLMGIVGTTAGATGLVQNGLFAFVMGGGGGGNGARPEYTQGIMVGQGIAGVLPALAQIVTVVALPKSGMGGEKDIGVKKDDDAGTKSEVNSRSAFVYFLAAVGVSMTALVALLYLLRRQRLARSRAAYRQATASAAKETARTRTTTNGSTTVGANMRPEAISSIDEYPADHTTARRTDHDRLSATPKRHSLNDNNEKPSIPLRVLFGKLPFLSSALLITFAITMFFPVFTVSITSIENKVDSAIFIPLGFLFWNMGDLLGRIVTLSPKVSLTHFPFALFCLAMARLIFIPMYFLCNIGGRGAIVSSDVFYLVVVQGLFGTSNGYVGSQCMMGANDWVLPEEREAAGGFMGLMLVIGLTVGSFLSFLVGGL